MPENNQNPKDFNDVDGLSITENDDGTFQLEWDENDPRYSIFKGLSELYFNVTVDVVPTPIVPFFSTTNELVDPVETNSLWKSPSK